jgi:sugar O-acyltransferase (sialic acid O-acetyltransferase NeuD family)
MNSEDIKLKPSKLRNLLIIGAGGFAREVFCWVNTHQYQVIGFYTEMEDGPREIFDTQVVRNLEGLPFDTDFIVAVGNPKVRQRLFEKAIQTRLIPCIPLVAPLVVIGRDVKIAHGSIICPGSVLTTNVTIETSVIVNLNCTVGHDSVLESFVTLSPGVKLSGNVRVGVGSYIGTNAAVREKLLLGPGSTLGMGAALTKDLPPGEMWTGVPASRMC